MVMHRTVHRPESGLPRGCLMALFVGLVLISGGPAASAADMTARELTVKLNQAQTTAPLELEDLDLSFLDLSELSFKRALMTGVDFYGTDITDADLSHTDLADTRLDRAVIIGTDFSYANLEGATIRLPTTFRDMKRNVREVATFAGANLNGARVLARLEGANFTGASLRKADFSALQPGTATIASVPRNYLTGARFDNADLRGADFSHASMNFASFVGADLRGASFVSADLVQANFTGAKLEGAVFTDADLSGAKLGDGKPFTSAKGLVPGAMDATAGQ